MRVAVKEIDEILVEKGILKLDQVKTLWDRKNETQKSVEELILELHFAEKADVLMAKAEKLEVDFIDLSGHVIEDQGIPTIITENVARKYGVIPLHKKDEVLAVAMKDPTDIFAIDSVRLATSLEIKPVFADPAEIDKLITAYFSPKPPVREETDAAVSAQKQDGNTEAGENAPAPSVSLKGKLGDMLVAAGELSAENLNAALEIQKTSGDLIGEILVRKGYIRKETVCRFLEKQMGIPYMELEGMEIPEEIIKLVNTKIARRYHLIPVEKDGTALKVAMSDPMNIFAIDDLRLATGMDVVPLLAESNSILVLLDKYYAIPKAEEKPVAAKKAESFEDELNKVREEIAVEIEENKETDSVIEISDIENAPVVKMVNLIFNKAIESGASDIHIEPYEDCILIRYRIDGQLVEIMRQGKKILPVLTARIKIISGLNIAEKRVPQDGRISIKVEHKNYDMRVSTLPTMFGEKVVIRIADKESFNISKAELGFFEDDLQKFDEILSNPHGIVLVTGPTGSGKSTTLYTALKELCKPNVNIITVEDPVECTIKGINQVQVNVKAGLDFPTALRSFLRQDPDIIMVGEIRDGITADIAIRAAITGHLVLSTLHTNDAASSINRLVDMGVEAFLISSSVVGIIAQRLVRKLCMKCREPYKPGLNEKGALQLENDGEASIYMPVGCPECNGTGYRGRIAIYEIMTVTKEIREAIVKNVNAGQLKELAVKGGMKTLRANCARLVRDGVTSMDEMMRVTFSKE